MQIKDGVKFFTVKEAAELTNYSIPYFYTPVARKRLGVEKANLPKGWLISEPELIKAGMLSESGEPLREGVAQDSASKDIQIIELTKDLNDVMEKLKELGQELYEERLAKTKLETELEQKDLQIKMLRELFIEVKGKDN
jgi:hypothetical protein